MALRIRIIYIIVLGIRFISSTNQPLLPDKGKKTEDNTESTNKDEIDIDDESDDDAGPDVKLSKQELYDN